MDSVYPTSMILELAGGKEGEMITTLSDARHMLGTFFSTGSSHSLSNTHTWIISWPEAETCERASVN